MFFGHPIGNDNLVHIWDTRKIENPVKTIDEHKAAVRAIGWCPISSAPIFRARR